MQRFVQDRYGRRPYDVHMHSATLPVSLLLATLAGVSAAPQQDGQTTPSASVPDALDRYRTQMANMSPQAPQTPADGALSLIHI